MLYVGSNDATKQEFTNSVQKGFDVKFLGGPAQKHTTHIFDQHCYVLNTLHCYNTNSQFPECEIPFPPGFTFSKDNRPVTDHNMHIFVEQRKCIPFCPTVCSPLNLAYNTFAVCNLAKANIYSRNFNVCALIWLIGFLRQCHTTLPNSTQTPIPIPSTTYATTLHTTYQLHHIF